MLRLPQDLEGSGGGTCDDFTALGTHAGLDIYEPATRANFGVKLKGRIGDGPGGVQEIRALIKGHSSYEGRAAL